MNEGQSILAAIIAACAGVTIAFITYQGNRSSKEHGTRAASDDSTRELIRDNEKDAIRRSDRIEQRSIDADERQEKKQREVAAELGRLVVETAAQLAVKTGDVEFRLETKIDGIVVRVEDFKTQLDGFGNRLSIVEDGKLWLVGTASADAQTESK